MLFDDVTNGSWVTKTYQEIVDIGNKEGSILVIPVGSIEQHGHHLPVSTDTILVGEVASHGVEKVHGKIPVLVTPVVWSGYSPHHMSFGGTISVDFNHLLSLLEDICESALKSGFDTVLLLNGHGGNIPLIQSAVSTIGTRESDTEILGLTYFQLAESFIDDIRDSDTGGMAHGGEFETSLMLYLRPELVREDRMTAEYWEEPYDLGPKDLLEGGPLAVYRPFREYSQSGAIGDPKLASEEKGEQIYSLLGDKMENLLMDIHERNKR